MLTGRAFLHEAYKRENIAFRKNTQGKFTIPTLSYLFYIEKQKAENRQNVTLEELYAEWLLYKRDYTSVKSKSSIQEYVSEWNRFFKDTELVKMKIGEIKPITLIAFQRSYKRPTVHAQEQSVMPFCFEWNNELCDQKKKLYHT